jgi:hypothetical protein
MKIYNIALLLPLYLALTAQLKALKHEETGQKALKAYEITDPSTDTLVMPAPTENEAFFGSRITRSVTLLSTSTKERRLPVKILIYGQSIVGSTVFTEYIRDYLTEQFPYADISLENKAIGGFNASRIIRTAVHDVYPYYPDLIIFHVYGGERYDGLERLFTNIRKYTTADILLLNHHLNVSQTPYNENMYQYLRYIANKYNCELVDLSKEWTRYLADNNLKNTDLLRDNTHPNSKGLWVMSQMVGRHLQYNSLFPGSWQDNVRTVYTTTAYNLQGENQVSFKGKKWEIVDGVPAGESKDAPLKLTFEGNRIDIVAGKLNNHETTGSARIILDGKPISKNKDLYYITRPGSGPNTWWPLVKRVSHIKELVPETWTLKVDGINADSTVWFFSVKGSVTGYDGSGNSEETFISKSGRVAIDVSDYMFTDIKRTFKTVTPVGFESSWNIKPLFIETYRTPVMDDESRVYKTTVVKGLKNGAHTLEIIPNGDGPVPIQAFDIHRPEMPVANY